MIFLFAALALSQLSATKVPVFDQKAPTSIECVAYIPDSAKVADKVDSTKASADPVDHYKLVTFEDERAVLKMAETLGYKIVSCKEPVTTASRESKVTISTKPLGGECAPVDSKCMYAPLDADGKPGKSIAAPNNLTFPAGTLTGCVIPPVNKALVQLYGFESMPSACVPAAKKEEATPGEVLPK